MKITFIALVVQVVSGARALLSMWVLKYAILPLHFGSNQIQFVTVEDVRILRDIGWFSFNFPCTWSHIWFSEQFYSTQIVSPLVTDCQYIYWLATGWDACECSWAHLKYQMLHLRQDGVIELFLFVYFRVIDQLKLMRKLGNLLL